MIEREAFITAQRRVVLELAGLIPADPEVSRAFEELALRTDDELRGQGVFYSVFDQWPESAFFALRQIEHYKARVSPECLEGWEDYERQYPRLLARNPRLELRNMMQDMSEMQEGRSWPEMWEWAIEEWVAEGNNDRPLYSVPPGFFERLSELHRMVGGWLYYDYQKQMVVFAEFDEFRKVKLRLDAERDTKRKENQRVAALNQGFPGKRELGTNAYIIYASDPPLAAEYDQFGQIILKRDPGNFAEIRRRLKKSQED